MTSNRAADRPAAWQELTAAAEEEFGWIAIADAEVRLAQARHPGQADLVYHAWPLLSRPHWLPRVPFVYAGYVRELLDRVATGQDTRPGTAAEVAAACSLVLDLKFTHPWPGCTTGCGSRRSLATPPTTDRPRLPPGTSGTPGRRSTYTKRSCGGG
jgi:hypothetical protein